MTTYYVGGTTQFAHRERDENGGLLPQALGRWSVSNPAVAEIDQSGLAHWLAPGDTEIIFVIDSYKRAGFFAAHVGATAPTTLVPSPSSVTLYPATIDAVSFAALDTLGHALTDFALDGASSSDEAIASVVSVFAKEIIVLGRAAGDVTITATSGSASVDIPVTVEVAAFLSEADADARYRQLGIRIPDSDVTKTPAVDLGNDVSGAVLLAWDYDRRAVAMGLVGDTTITLTDLPVGEFQHVDVETQAGGHALAFVMGAGMPRVEWDDDEGAPLLVTAPNRRESFMFHNDVRGYIVASRTWQNVPTT
jgi:hypothetical protein